jgi:electron transport complex protein RnfA
MSAAVTFVMTLATLVTSLVYSFILVPFNIQFLKTVFFILVIAALVQMVELILKKVSPPLYKALGVYLPLITTNCAILGVAVLVVKDGMGILESVVFALANAIGFGLAIVIFAGLRERFKLYGIPKALEGAPIALITAGLLSLAFLGFSGMFQ